MWLYESLITEYDEIAFSENVFFFLSVKTKPQFFLPIPLVFLLMQEYADFVYKPR